MRMKPKLMTIAAVGLIAALTGCGSSATNEGSDPAGTASQTSSPSPTAPASSTSPDAAPSDSTAESVVITIKDFKYTIPASVAPGAKVTVKNDDTEKHTLTSAAKGAFDVSADGRGGTATFTAPTKPGSSPFICTLHADMEGTLVVK